MSSNLQGRSILFVVTEDWYFISHRLPVARAARDAGMEVHVATRVCKHGAAIRAEGFVLHSLSWRRSSIGLFGLVAGVLALRRILCCLQPNLLHAVALKPVVFCALATLRLSTRPIFAINGLGFVFTECSLRAALLRTLLLVAFNSVDREVAYVLLQNDDDAALLHKQGFIRRAPVKTIRGSGIDTSRFVPLPPPSGLVPIVAVVARMIAIKGIADLVSASRLLRERGVKHRLILVGDPDPENPSSIPREQLSAWADEPCIEWHGAVSDVRQIWAQADIAALTSKGGEGLPKALLEAAACARPIVATDVPGSRDVVVHGKTGLLALAGDVVGIADALQTLIADRDLRDQFGRAGRVRIEALFSQERITAETLALYEETLVRGASTAT